MTEHTSVQVELLNDQATLHTSLVYPRYYYQVNHEGKERTLTVGPKGHERLQELYKQGHQQVTITRKLWDTENTFEPTQVCK